MISNTALTLSQYNNVRVIRDKIYRFENMTIVNRTVGLQDIAKNFTDRLDKAQAFMGLAGLNLDLNMLEIPTVDVPLIESIIGELLDIEDACVDAANAAYFANLKDPGKAVGAMWWAVIKFQAKRVYTQRVLTAMKTILRTLKRNVINALVDNAFVQSIASVLNATGCRVSTNEMKSLLDGIDKDTAYDRWVNDKAPIDTPAKNIIVEEEKENKAEELTFDILWKIIKENFTEKVAQFKNFITDTWTDFSAIRTALAEGDICKINKAINEFGLGQTAANRIDAKNKIDYTKYTMPKVAPGWLVCLTDMNFGDLSRLANAVGQLVPGSDSLQNTTEGLSEIFNLADSIETDLGRLEIVANFYQIWQK